MKQNNFPTDARRQLRICRDAFSEVQDQVRRRMREATLAMAVNLMTEELVELCGPKFSRKEDGQCTRAGSDPGSIILNGQRVTTRRPRVKDAKGREVDLASYTALQDFDLLSDKITRHVLSGVSTRDYEGLCEEVAGGVGLKKSTVSKAFKRGSKKMLDELNNRDLSAFRFAALMIDSIDLGGRAVVTVLGITLEGKKLILGIREGNTENWEVVRDLFHNLVDRGLYTKDPILFVLDGAKALKKAVHKLFGRDAFIQRCIRHKERNILQYIPEANHKEFRRRWKKLHGMVKLADAQTEYESLVRYLGEINQQAADSLEEAGQETLTVIRLGMPSLLRKTLASTNPIESPFDRVKSRSSRVKNWHTGLKSKQILRWSASLLLDAEKKFRMIRGHKEIPALIAAMKNSTLQTQLEVA